MSLGENIKMYRKAKRLTQQELAELSKLSRSYIADVERDRYNPSVDTLQTIASALGIKPSALMGEEEPLNESKMIKLDMTTVEMIKIPVYGEIRAGYNSLAQQDIIGYEIVSKDSVADGEYFFLIVKGDSMIEEGIREGMRVLVRKQRTCQHGKIGVVVVNGDEGTLKRVFYEDDNVILQASNRNIPPRVYPIEDVMIQGQVTQVIFDV